MALTQILVDRLCPQDSFEYLEEAVAGCVGDVFYGEPDPDKASVDVTTAHARLSDRRFMSLNVLVDTEDLPGPGWAITASGLCVRPDASVDSEPVTVVSPEGLDPKQVHDHQKFQAKQLYKVVTGHSMWQPGKIGWPDQQDPAFKLRVRFGIQEPTSKLGILVAKIEGAWVDASTEEPSSMKTS